MLLLSAALAASTVIPPAAYLPVPDSSAPRVAADGLSLWTHHASPGHDWLWSAPMSAPLEGRARFDAGPGLQAWRPADVPGRVLLRRGDAVVSVDEEGGGAVPLVGPAERLVAYDMLGHVVVERDVERGVVVEARDEATGASTLLWSGRHHDHYFLDDATGAVTGAWDRRFWGDRLYRVDAHGEHRAWDALGTMDTEPLIASAQSHAGEVFVSAAARDGLAALWAVSLATGKSRLIDAPQRGDVVTWVGARRDPRPRAVAELYAHQEWTVLDPAVADDTAAIGAALGPNWSVEDTDVADRIWLVSANSATTFDRHFVYDRASRTLRRAPPGWGALDAAPWRPSQELSVTARDGTPLVAYLLTPDPARFGPAPWPVVVKVHGGPGSRDAGYFDPEAQAIVDGGMAVLTVNFRGSSGFGWAFGSVRGSRLRRLTAADIDDALAEAVRAGLVSANHQAIVGASYGGYAVLAALAASPGRFGCGVGMAAPYRALGYATLRHADHIQDPLLLAYGDQDEVVPYERRTRPFVDRIDRTRAPFTLVEFTEAGHGLSDADFDAWVSLERAALQACLGVPVDALSAAALRGANVRVREGAGLIAGLAASVDASGVPLAGP